MEATIHQRQPFLYVDLTSKDVLPIWLHPKAVGGRFRQDEANLLNGDEPVDSLARLGAALRNATESQRFFRSFSQWSAAWWKYVPIAVSVSQLSWVSAIAHADVVAQIVETERAEGRSGYLAFFYDELLRRQLAARAAKSDPNLDILDSLSKLDRPLLEVARTRLDAALQAAGVHQKGGAAAMAASSSLLALAHDAARTMTTQQSDQLQAAASMQRQQQGKGGKRQRPAQQEPS